MSDNSNISTQIYEESKFILYNYDYRQRDWMAKITVNDVIATALSKLIDDAKIRSREPTHYDLDCIVEELGLGIADPKKQGAQSGKSKRVGAVLSWAINNDETKASSFAEKLIAKVQGCGGFREKSNNFVGFEAIENLRNAFKTIGLQLASDGCIVPLVLDCLTGDELTDALKGYIARAKKGAEDGALILGTSKDLMEAVAAHILQSLYGTYSQSSNFPTLLGQAFIALEMQATKPSDHSNPRLRMEYYYFETACSINSMRNKHGTGHGRPWLTDLSHGEAKSAIEFMGVLSEFLLNKLIEKIK